MDDREWQTFVTVVDEGNITRAAEKLFLSQPALSYRLRHMEKPWAILYCCGLLKGLPSRHKAKFSMITVKE